MIKKLVVILALAITQSTLPMEQPSWWQRTTQSIRYAFGLETQDEMNKRLLHEAETGNIEAVKWLIEHGADVNAEQNNLGDSALMLASQGNHPNVVQLLLLHNATVNWRDRFTRYTALHIAASAWSPEVVHVLLTTISQEEAENLRKRYATALLSLKFKEHPTVSKDIRQVIGNRLIDVFVDEYSARIERLLSIEDRNNRTPYFLFRWGIGHLNHPELEPILNPTNPQGRESLRPIIRKNILNILFGEIKSGQQKEVPK